MAPVEPVYARFGAQVRRLRKGRGLTQTQLAQLIDPDGERIGRSSIANIEAGSQRVALHLLLDLAAALEVDPAVLLPAATTPLEASSPVEHYVRGLQPQVQDWVRAVVAAPERGRKKRATPA